MTPKRGDAVAPPPGGGEYDVRFGTSDAAAQWPELCRRFPGNCREAWEAMRLIPLQRTPKQKPLQGRLSTRIIGGIELPQWQFDVSGGARLLYCVDVTARTVWLVDVSAGHPGATLAKGKRSSRNR